MGPIYQSDKDLNHIRIDKYGNIEHFNEYINVGLKNGKLYHFEPNKA